MYVQAFDIKKFAAKNSLVKTMLQVKWCVTHNFLLQNFTNSDVTF